MAFTGSSGDGIFISGLNSLSEIVILPLSEGFVPSCCANDNVHWRNLSLAFVRRPALIH